MEFKTLGLLKKRLIVPVKLKDIFLLTMRVSMPKSSNRCENKVTTEEECFSILTSAASIIERKINLEWLFIPAVWQVNICKYLLKRRFGDSHSLMILNMSVISNMTQSPPPFCITFVPAGSVGGWQLYCLHAELIPCSCEMAVKSISLNPSSLHYNTHHCIGMYRIIMNESLSVWQDGGKKRAKTWCNMNDSFRESEWMNGDWSRGDKTSSRDQRKFLTYLMGKDQRYVNEWINQSISESYSATYSHVHLQLIVNQSLCCCLCWWK